MHTPGKLDIDIKSSLKSWKNSNGIVHVLFIVQPCCFSYVL